MPSHQAASAALEMSCKFKPVVLQNFLDDLNLYARPPALITVQAVAELIAPSSLKSRLSRPHAPVAIHPVAGHREPRKHMPPREAASDPAPWLRRPGPGCDAGSCGAQSHFELRVAVLRHDIYICRSLRAGTYKLVPATEQSRKKNEFSRRKADERRLSPEMFLDGSRRVRGALGRRCSLLPACNSTDKGLSGL